MRLLFIITGSIAVSKIHEILEKIKQKDIYVDCVFTKSAEKLTTLKNFKKLIKGNIYYDRSEKKNKMLHISLSRSSDLIVVCPATANTIAKLANGYGDNLASTILLASNKEILFIPAMNSKMWSNKLNQKNVNYLKKNGYEFFGPDKGKLKCGELGMGRLANTKKIVNKIFSKLDRTKLFYKKKCLVTAGPTIEFIDPIRYISNFSSGKQGYEIANQLVLSGANVTLISGPTNLEPPHNVKMINVKSAHDMFKAVKKANKNIDLAVFAAAVSDFKIKSRKNKKIKKNNIKKLNLTKNIDILNNISNKNKDRPKIVVGFAAETEGLHNAKSKLVKKNCDMIIYNQITKKNKIFNSDSNKITIISKNKILKNTKTSKVNCAKKILNAVYQLKNNYEI